ncbi:MAG TPA: hypothetical protein PKY12_07535 [Catalimonadaceae bacterium]|nr:hypothetical protein [Catalimonadaceae bacterium]
METQFTPEAKEKLGQLQELLPHIEAQFLVETSLALTQSLFEKSAQGAHIEVKWPDGKVEELRFEIKKSRKKKGPQTNS